MKGLFTKNFPLNFVKISEIGYTDFVEPKNGKILWLWPSVTRWLKSGRVHYILINNIIFAKMAEMSKYQIPYTNACIRAFGRRFSITTKEAYQYLQKYKGIGFLIEFYEIEHLQSIEDAVDDLIVFCKNNGGHLS